MDKFRQFGSIISVTTDVILARCNEQPATARTFNRVEKIIGSAEKNRVGREPEPQVFFFTPNCLNSSIGNTHL
jgi:hypothetical protein